MILTIILTPLNQRPLWQVSRAPLSSRIWKQRSRALCKLASPGAVALI